MKATYGPIADATVMFYTELLDIGGGYNPSTGVYTAPQAGTYTFTWTLHIMRSGIYMTGLVVNDTTKNRMVTNTENWSTNSSDSYAHYSSSTATSTVQLTTGDKVFIRVLKRYGEPNIIHNDGYSTFYGWMLH